MLFFVLFFCNYAIEIKPEVSYRKIEKRNKFILSLCFITSFLMANLIGYFRYDYIATKFLFLSYLFYFIKADFYSIFKWISYKEYRKQKKNKVALILNFAKIFMFILHIIYSHHFSDNNIKLIEYIPIFITIFEAMRFFVKKNGVSDYKIKLSSILILGLSPFIYNIDILRYPLFPCLLVQIIDLHGYYKGWKNIE